MSKALDSDIALAFVLRATSAYCSPEQATELMEGLGSGDVAAIELLADLAGDLARCVAVVPASAKAVELSDELAALEASLNESAARLIASWGASRPPAFH